MIGGAPVGTVPSLSSTTRGCAREMACCMPRHQAMPLTAMPGGMGRVWGRRPGPSERQRRVCRYTGDNCLRNNTTTDSNTQTSSDPGNSSPCENSHNINSWSPPPHTHRHWENMHPEFLFRKNRLQS